MWITGQNERGDGASSVGGITSCSRAVSLSAGLCQATSTLAAALLLSIAELAYCAAPAAPRSRPNILFIMSDDHAYQAISAYRSPLELNQTPNIDRIAREGALFSNAFVTNSICSPSRATILTGLYSHLNGVTQFNHIDPAKTTVASLLQQGGYYTSIVGKWHLGTDPVGFNHWEILPGQGQYNDPLLYSGDDEHHYKGYVTDIITDLALKELQDRPKDKPFFLMVHHKAPHRNFMPAAKYADLFKGKHIPEPPTFWDTYATRTDALHVNKQRIAGDMNNSDLKIPPPAGMTSPEEIAKWQEAVPDSVTVTRDGKPVVLKGEELVRWKYQRYMQDYLATVQSIDDGVGRILDYLDKSGLAKNTIVFYTSDQGMFLGEHGLFDKRYLYEESVRTPMMVRWPRRIKPGTRIDAMSLNLDLPETFLAMAGLPQPADMQGRSLVPVMTGKVPADWRTSFYYRYYDSGHNASRHNGIRTQRYTLVHFLKEDQWELYDLQHDPLQLDNLYGRDGMEKVTADLQEQLARLKREVRDDDQFANDNLPYDAMGGRVLMPGQKGKEIRASRRD